MAMDSCESDRRGMTLLLKLVELSVDLLKKHNHDLN